MANLAAEGKSGWLVNRVGGRDVSDASARLEAFEFPDAAGRDVLEFGGDPDYLRVGSEIVEEAGEPEFGFQVGAVADAADDGDRVVEFGDEVGEEPAEAGDLVEPELGLESGESFGHGLACAGFLAVDADGEDDLVEGLFSLAEDREVSEVEGIEGARVEGDAWGEGAQEVEALGCAGGMGWIRRTPTAEEFGTLFPVRGEGHPLELAEDGLLVTNPLGEGTSVVEGMGVELEEAAGDFGCRRRLPHRCADRLGDEATERGVGLGGMAEPELGAVLLVVVGTGIVDGVVVEGGEQEGGSVAGGRFGADGVDEPTEVSRTVPIPMAFGPAAREFGHGSGRFAQRFARQPGMDPGFEGFKGRGHAGGGVDSGT